MSQTAQKEYIELPRGGYLVDTQEGYVQFGSPPETIKDTMRFEKQTPLVFVLPNKFFHVEKGISVAELEFPIYFNFFIRKKKTFILCTEEQKDQLTTVLRESVMGPSDVDLVSEFIDGEDTPGFPDMKKEMGFFRSYKDLDEVVEFHLFKEGRIRFGTIIIEKLETGDFLVRDNGREIQVPGEVGFNIKFDIGKRLEEPFEAPLLGITCLGPSHGFDPEDNTSGFILWINHQGIMVDPPVNSTEWLRESNVNPKLINHVILTHCHADHDAGTFQKILEEGKINIFATTTVMDSFLRKYCALTKIPKKEAMELFEYTPIIIGKPMFINGAEFYFHYAVHSIPSTGFQFFFHDQSFIYTGDHLNDPTVFDTMKEKGVLTENRYRFLKDFPWDRQIIYHEAGVPPLHTKISYLASLPEEVQKRITVYHIAKKDMPPGTSLKLATFGIENTLIPSIAKPAHQEAYNLLDILSRIDIFQGYPITKSKEFLQIAKVEEFKRGQLVFKKGDIGNKFFILAKGNVKFEGLANDDGNAPVKRYGMYEYFGEASLILNQPRAANVVAETDVTAITIEKAQFLQFIRGSDLKESLEKLNAIRDTNSWRILTESKSFKNLTSYQITQLELLLGLEKFPNDMKLIQENRHFDKAYIIRSGKVVVSQNGKEVKELGVGDFVGEIYNLEKSLPAGYSFVTKEPSELYAIEKEELIQYIKKNPGVYMRMNTAYN